MDPVDAVGYVAWVVHVDPLSVLTASCRRRRPTGSRTRARQGPDIVWNCAGTDAPSHAAVRAGEDGRPGSWVLTGQNNSAGVGSSDGLNGEQRLGGRDGSPGRAPVGGGQHEAWILGAHAHDPAVIGVRAGRLHQQKRPWPRNPLHSPVRAAVEVASTLPYLVTAQPWLASANTIAEIRSSTRLLRYWVVQVAPPSVLASLRTLAALAGRRPRRAMRRCTRRPEESLPAGQVLPCPASAAVAGREHQLSPSVSFAVVTAAHCPAVLCVGEGHTGQGSGGARVLRDPVSATVGGRHDDPTVADRPR